MMMMSPSRQSSSNRSAESKRTREEDAPLNASPKTEAKPSPQQGSKGVTPARSDSIRKVAMVGGSARAASEVITAVEDADTSTGQIRLNATKPSQNIHAGTEEFAFVATANEASDKTIAKEKQARQEKQAEKEIEIQQLWEQFVEDRSNNRIRDKLVLHYLHLVKYTVNRLPLTLPNSVSQDDIISYGTLGLLDAVRRFEPDRGWKFETFAVNRIRGEVIDQLRTQDWVPRGVRRRAKRVTEVMNELQTKLGRHPSDEEMARAMDVSLHRYHKILNECSVLVLSLDEQLGSDRDSTISLMDTVADKNTHPPDNFIEDGDLQTHVAQAIHKLPEREKLLIALYYQENMTLREIGQIINISESRVCQLHAQAIMRLRHRLARLM